MSKSSYTPEFRAKIAQEYLNGNCSRKDLSKKYNIPESTIRDWINVYKTHGINAFINTNGNKQYTKDFKIQCVEAVLKGESSVLDVVSQYQISSSHMLREWISLYNANRELKEIVDYCINHNRDYKGTASIYNVSYSQVYSWFLVGAAGVGVFHSAGYGLLLYGVHVLSAVLVGMLFAPRSGGLQPEVLQSITSLK